MVEGRSRKGAPFLFNGHGDAGLGVDSANVDDDWDGGADWGIRWDGDVDLEEARDAAHGGDGSNDAGGDTANGYADVG